MSEQRKQRRFSSVTATLVPGEQQKQPSIDELAKQQADAIVNGARQMMAGLVNNVQALYQQFWYPQGGRVRPEDIAKAMGDQLGPIFEDHEAIKTFLLATVPTIKPEQIPGVPKDFEVTINADGTGVVTRKTQM